MDPFTWGAGGRASRGERQGKRSPQRFENIFSGHELRKSPNIRYYFRKHLNDVVMCLSVCLELRTKSRGKVRACGLPCGDPDSPPPAARPFWSRCHKQGCGCGDSWRALLFLVPSDISQRLF